MDSFNIGHHCRIFRKRQFKATVTLFIFPVLVGILRAAVIILIMNELRKSADGSILIMVHGTNAFPLSTLTKRPANVLLAASTV